LLCTAGTVRWYGGRLTALDGTSATRPVEVTGGTVELYDVHVSASSGAGTVVDLQRSAGTLRVTGGKGSDTNGGYTTSGTVTYSGSLYAALQTQTHVSADITDASDIGNVTGGAGKVAIYDADRGLGAAWLTLYTDIDDITGGIRLKPAPDDATHNVYLPTPDGVDYSVAYQEWVSAGFQPLDADLTVLAGQTVAGEVAANLVYAGPDGGGADNPSFRALVDADIPAAITRDAEIDTSAELRSLVTDKTGTGALMFTRTGVRRTIYVNAGAMIGRTTNGAATGTTETATNDVMFDTFDFDTSTEEGVGFWLTLPSAWDAGTVTAKFHWTASSSSGTVKWDIAGRCYVDDDAVDQAMGTEQTATADTLLATGDVHISATTPALTLGGTPTANRPCYFQITRDVGGDTLAADAKLMGVTIEFTESATEPSSQ
jgi:hypothetical protein